VLSEIDDIKRGLAVIATPPQAGISIDTIEALGTEGRFAVLFERFQKVVGLLGRIEIDARDAHRETHDAIVELAERMDSFAGRLTVFDARMGTMHQALARRDDWL
jgi:hypothetical protein